MIGAGSLPRPTRQVGLVLGVATLGVCLATAITFGPIVALVPLGLVGAVLLLLHPTLRVGFLVFGALFALQSSQQLDAVKLGYLAGALVAFGAALFHVREATQGRRLILASLMGVALVAIGTLVSFARGIDPILAFRDATAYLLLAAAPLLALDAATAAPGTLRWIFLVAGTLTTLSWGLVWASVNHHIVALPIERLFYPSLMLSAALFAYGMAQALDRRERRIRWLLLASLIFAIALLTGTRTAILLLVIPAVLVVSRQLRSRRFQRVIILTGATAVVAASLALLIQASAADTSLLLHRFEQLTTDPSSDASVQQRAGETSSAWEAFVGSPFFGVGLGSGFAYETPTGTILQSADTSVAFLGKFGLVGAAFALTISVIFWSATSEARRRLPPMAAVFSAYGAFVISVLAFVNPFEEKGSALALILLASIVLSHARRRHIDVFQTSISPTAPAAPQ